MAGGALLVVFSFALAPRRDGLLVVAFAAAGLLFACLAVAPGASWAPVASGVLALAVALSARGRFERARARARLASLLAISGSFVALRAVWESLWGLEAAAENLRSVSGVAWREEIVGRLEQGRAYAGHMTPAAAGVFLVLAFAATAGLAFATRGRLRLLNGVAAALQLAGLAATRSLTAGGTLLFVAAIAGFALLSRKRGMAALAVTGAALAIVAVGVAVRGTSVVAIDHPDSPWRLRAGNVRIAAEMAVAHPWMGVGPGGYGESFSQYRREQDNESRHVHSLPVELAAEFGLPAGAALTLAFFVFFLGGLGRAVRSGDSVRAGLALGAAAFAIHNLGDFSAWLPSILWSAILAAAASRDKGGDTGAPRWGAAATACVAGGAIVAAASGLAHDARRSGLDAAAGGDVEGALALLDRAAKLAPWDPDAALALAGARVDAAVRNPRDPEARLRALASSERAVEASPVRASARSLRARARLVDGDLPGALADLVAAVHLHPVREEYRDDLEALRSKMAGGGR
jgi:O-antigen ligase